MVEGKHFAVHLNSTLVLRGGRQRGVRESKRGGVKARGNECPSPYLSWATCSDLRINGLLGCGPGVSRNRAASRHAAFTWQLHCSSPPCLCFLPPFFPAGCERHVCGWEDWLPHVCVWVNGALYQYSPLLKWPAEAGHSLWRDADRGGEGVPRPPGCAGCLQRVLLAGLGRADGKWPGGQPAGRGIVCHHAPAINTSPLHPTQWGRPPRSTKEAKGSGSRVCPPMPTPARLWLWFLCLGGFWIAEGWTCSPHPSSPAVTPNACGSKALRCFSSPFSPLPWESYPSA